MLSVNMPTYLKMCGSGSRGQVDVIIFLLDGRKKNKTKNSRLRKKTGNKLFHSHHAELSLEPFLKAR